MSLRRLTPLARLLVNNNNNNKNVVKNLRLQIRPIATTSQVYSTPVTEKTKNTPTNETLLKVDWLLQNLTPLVLKSNIRNFIDICDENVLLDDKIFKYKLSGRSALMSHIAKVRMYYRYLSPFNKVEWIGSCVYENEDVVVVLWRLSTLESNFWSYFPSFLTKKEPKILVKEGALDVRVNAEGRVLSIINRTITASDREGAKSLAKIKAEQEELRIKAEEKEMRKEFDRQYHS